MRVFAFLLVAVVVMLAVSPETPVQATPSGFGLPVFSVRAIDATHDITPAPNGGGRTCSAADVLFPPVFPVGGTVCAPRVAPAPPGPVPDTMTNAVVNMGLNTAGAFTDDLDALSFGETVGSRVVTDYDFSVDPAPANGGVTVGAPAAGCPAPNVTTQAAALEAQGDIFTTLGAPAGCNQVAPTGCLVAPASCDESQLGLIAPNPGAPGVAPLDDVDALAEMPDAGGTCVWGGIGRICPAFSLTAGSITIGLAPADTFTLLPPDAATLFVPPGAIPNPPNLAGGCPIGGTACAAVHSSSLGLVPGDELDALCWFDTNGDRTVDLPTTVMPNGDTYLFSLAPGSPTLGALGYSAADILAPTPGVPIVSVPAATLGLLPTDNLDALTCHLVNTDRDGDGYTDITEFGAPLCANAVNDDALVDALDGGAANDGCPVLGAAEAACADAIDSDGDGLVNDGCPMAGLYQEAPGCMGSIDDDGDGVANDGCPARGAPEAACADAADSDGDGLTNDGCPVVGAAAELANNTMTLLNGRCEAGAVAPSTQWPSDFISGGVPNSTDRVNITDLTSFLAPVRRLGTSPPMAGFNPRWDLIPGAGLFPSWIAINDLTALIAGAPGFPPMLGGVKAFNGPACVDP